MKKNRMMRLASILLVCVLMTTSVISGTFAKYVTTDEQNDIARVAKFGVVAAVQGNLFGATYVKADDNTITSYGINDGTVSSDDGEFVVAPGTENINGMELYITGVPEVATKVYLDAVENDEGVSYADSEIYLNAGSYGVMVPYNGEVTAENDGDLFVYVGNGNNYYTSAEGYAGKSNVKFYSLQDTITFEEKYNPLTWYLNGEPVNGDLSEMKKQLTEMFSKEFKPNESLAALNTTVGWKWEYGTARNGKDENIVDNDKKDTILGHMMADQEGGLSENMDVVVKVGDSYKVVTYTNDFARSNGKDLANKIVLVKAADANGSSQTIGCLTVALSTRLTVEQVD